MRQKTFPLQGGLDLDTPKIATEPGTLLHCTNFEAADPGYQRILGYERFDGRPMPSEATFWIMTPSGVTGTPLPGEQFQHAGGLPPTGSLLAFIFVRILSDGRWLLTGDDLVSYETIAGPYEGLDSGASVNVDTIGSANDADTAELQSQYLIEVMEQRRSRIGGTTMGSIRGLFWLKGSLYCMGVRGKMTATHGGVGHDIVINRSSPGGWEEVSMGKRIRFINGNNANANGEQDLQKPGAAFVGGTSSEAGTIASAYVTDGALKDGTAQGYIYYLPQTAGEIQDGEQITVEDTGIGQFTMGVDGAPEDVGFQLGPIDLFTRFQAVVHNFGALKGTGAAYITTGSTPAFFFDGEHFAPIWTDGVDEEDDIPRFVAPHQNHLVMAYDGGRLRISSLGFPMTFNPLVGAGEVAIGDDINGMVPERGTTLAISTHNSWKALVGTDADNFEVQTIAPNNGAKIFTSQQFFGTVFVDDRGIGNLAASEKYGNFEASVISQKVQPLLEDRITPAFYNPQFNSIPDSDYTQMRLVTDKRTMASTICRTKNQYRLHFGDGQAIWGRLTGSGIQWTTCSFDRPFMVFWSGEDDLGRERIFAAAAEASTVGDAEDGARVYEMERGWSFDGEGIEAFMVTNYHHYDTPNRKKSFRKFTMDIEAPIRSTVTMSLSLDFGADDGNSVEADIDVSSSDGALWGTEDWGQFFWGGTVVRTTTAYLSGQGFNTALVWYTDTADIGAMRFNTVTVEYLTRGPLR